MWFKNLRVYTLPQHWNITAEQLTVALATQAFAECSSIEMTSTGWIPPIDGGDLVHAVGRQMLLTLCTEKKLLPTSVIKEYTKLRAAEVEEQQGYKPGRKQMKEIKEEVTDELLPRAFSVKSRARVWIDPVNGWLAVDTSSAVRAQETIARLIKSMGGAFPGTSLQTQTPPMIAMSCWLTDDAAPAGFTIDDHIELSSTGESKGKVKYVKLSVDIADVQKHIATGKQCTQLALTWKDRISFILTESLTIRRVTALDVLKESDVGYSADEAEKFDSDFTLMTGELHQLITHLVAALGGVAKEKTEAANDAAGNAGPHSPERVAA